MKKFRLAILFIFSIVSIAISASMIFGPDWQTADRSSTGIAPDPGEVTDAVVQVYAARAFNWRSLLAVHTWIASKEKEAKHYTVYQVVGWRKRRGLPVVVREQDIPDRSWFGHQPNLLADFRGVEAESMIHSIETAVATYPYADTYHMWPGPNSNTFIAHIGRSVPQLKLDMPPTAIGKDYLTRNLFVDKPPSGSGFQFSFFGVFGGIVSAVEGLEINILGINFGMAYTPKSIWPLKLRLPFFGVVPLASETESAATP